MWVMSPSSESVTTNAEHRTCLTSLFSFQIGICKFSLRDSLACKGSGRIAIEDSISNITTVINLMHHAQEAARLPVTHFSRRSSKGPIGLLFFVFIIFLLYFSIITPGLFGALASRSRSVLTLSTKRVISNPTG